MQFRWTRSKIDLELVATYLKELNEMANEPQTQNETQAETPKETPREKFVRLAETRVSNALHSLTVIGNLAAPSYEYSEDDIAKIETALTEKLSTVIAHLRNPGERREETFKLG